MKNPKTQRAFAEPEGTDSASVTQTARRSTPTRFPLPSWHLDKHRPDFTLMSLEFSGFYGWYHWPLLKTPTCTPTSIIGLLCGNNDCEGDGIFDCNGAHQEEVGLWRRPSAHLMLSSFRSFRFFKGCRLKRWMVAVVGQWHEK